MHAESKAIYGVANGQVEKWSAIIHFLTTKLSPVCLIVPKSIFCYLMYFTTDLAVEDAFELPLPFWSVYNFTI